MQVLVQPASNPSARQHLDNTIYSPVDVGELIAVDPQAKILMEDAVDGRVHMWALKPEVNKKKGALQPGQAKILHDSIGNPDEETLVIFVDRGIIVAWGVVGATFVSRPVSQIHWNDAQVETPHGIVQAPFEYIYGVRGVERTNMDYAQFIQDINEATGKDRNTRTPMGALLLRGVEADAAASILTETGYVPRGKTTRCQYRGGAADRAVKGSMREEQPALREHKLGGRPTARCVVCKRVFPARHLRASHYKLRSRCSPEERLDFDHVAGLMCVFGCDAAFEAGDITIRDDRVVVSSGVDDALREALRSALHGESLDLPVESAPYLEWHATHRFERHIEG